MTRDEVLARLESIEPVGHSDPERAGSEAEDAICEFLISLGYEDVVTAFQKIWRH